MDKFIFAALAVLTVSDAAAATLPTVVRGGTAPQVTITPAPTNTEPVTVTVCVRRPNSIAGLTLTRCRDVGTLSPSPPSSQPR